MVLGLLQSCTVPMCSLFSEKSLATKVHATKCCNFARSSIHEVGDCLSASTKFALHKAGKAQPQNAERDLHRIFQHSGLSLPIKPQCATYGMQDVHFMSMKTWWPYLIKERSEYVMGGFSRKDPTSTLLLKNFWKQFQSNYHDHAVFDLHDSPSRLGKAIPYYLHIDEGTGLRKSAVLVINMQCALGIPSSTRFATSCSHVTSHSFEDLERRLTECQFHNGTGTTYKTRFLYTVLPKKAYSNKNSHVYWGVLETLAQECKDLMENGVQVCGGTWYPICLGIKGDMPALVKSGRFKRSFMNLGHNKGICYECLAGYVGYEFEDTHDQATWMATVGLVEPWDAQNASPFASVPCQPSMPHAFWKRDPFHAFKQTLGGHFGASTVVLFAVDFKLWKVQGESADVTNMFERAFTDFKFFVQHEWRKSVVNHTQAFTRQTLHFPSTDTFPYARWKGSDQMLIIRWLKQLVLYGPVFADSFSRDDSKSLLHFPPCDWQRPYFQAVLNACDAALSFFQNMHTQGLWLTRHVASAMSSDCKKVCLNYRVLANLCHEKGLARFHLEPCLHNFRHFAHDLDVALARGCEWIYSPSSQNCDMDEDFVGRIARGTKAVHALTTNIRTIERYLLRCHAEFTKAEDP